MRLNSIWHSIAGRDNKSYSLNRPNKIFKNEIRKEEEEGEGGNKIKIKKKEANTDIRIKYYVVSISKANHIVDLS